MGQVCCPASAITDWPDGNLEVDLFDRASLIRWLEWADVKLIDTAWLCRAEIEQITRRRQELPDDAFVPFVELETKPICSLTYGWGDPANPDPNGRYARALQTYFERERFKGEHPHGAALFWDHKSLYQHEIDGAWDGNPETREEYMKVKRSDKEDMYFKRALTGMHALYFHEDTEGVIISEVPEEGRNRRPYEERGWTAMECAGLGLSGKVKVIDLSGSEPGTGLRAAERMALLMSTIFRDATIEESKHLLPYLPPMVPSDFRKELYDKRTFTKSGDKEEVFTMYCSGFESYVKHATRLTVDRSPLQKYDVDDILSRSLPMFQTLEELHMLYDGGGRSSVRTKLDDVLNELEEKGCVCREHRKS